MALIGYQRKAERKNGGIRTLGLIAASDVTSVNYSAEDRALFELTLAAEKNSPNTNFAKTKPNTVKTYRSYTIRPLLLTN